MTLRRQPPVYSPVSVAGLVAGSVAALGSAAPLDRLRRRLGQRFGGMDALLLDSGTSALRFAIAAARKADRPIAVPAWACYDIISAAAGAGVRMAFYDVHPETLQPDETSLNAVAAVRPCGVVVVHAYGVPVDTVAVRRAVGSEPLLIEDAAQAWGGASGDKPLGSLGDVSVFSFGRGKGITGGRGGALVVRTADAVSAAPGSAGAGWKNVAVGSALMLLSRPWLYGIPASLPWLRLGETVYKPPRAPAPMDRSSAAMIDATLDEADREAARRRANAERLRQSVDRCTVARNVTVATGASPGWLRLPVLARNTSVAQRLVSQGGRFGVAAAYPKDLPSLATELGLAPLVPGPVVGAQTLTGTMVTLPTHGGLSESDLAGIERILAEARDPA